MRYINGNPYFSKNDERARQFKYLNGDFNCNILIVGGGIDGAICNYYLSNKFDDVALVEAKRIGCGCTSCATALLEYQLDDFASDLKKYYTEEEIVAIYKMGQKSKDAISQFIKENGDECQFREKSTFLFSNKKKDIKAIKEEHSFRKKQGFSCEYYDNMHNPYCFDIKSGLYCADGGAEFNPYLFAKQMICRSTNNNNIFENTAITNIENEKDGLIVTTEFGNTIKCKKVILATGFDFRLYKLKNLCDRFISYSLVTEPNAINWFDSSLLQDTEDPYHYIRKLNDGRIIFGGGDIPYKGKFDIKKTIKAYEKLYRDLVNLFSIQKIKIENKFCGIFGSTDNNLGIIGKTNQENVLAFMSCGANGIINSFCGVEIISDILEGKKNYYEKFFSPLRI